MGLVTIFALLLAIGVAAANGSNDVSKGVATLAGAGVTRHRTAILWGAVTTLVGSFVSIGVAQAMTKLFSDGILKVTPTPVFALAVLFGTTAWVALATFTSLPVSTTQALVGSMIGAGLLFAPSSVNWSVLLTKVAQPMVLSIVIVFGIAFVLSKLPGRVPECVCAEVQPAIDDPQLAPAGGAHAFTTTDTATATATQLTITTGTAAECKAHSPTAKRALISVSGLHWFSSGAASFARGLNDTPKIVAVGAFALIPAGMTTSWLLTIVALSMFAGGVLGGMNVAKRLSSGVVKMSDLEGLKANATTATLVSLGAWQGWAMSTTQVSTGAIAGRAGDVSRINMRTMRDFAIAWTVTPAVAGVVAAAVYFLATR